MEPVKRAPVKVNEDGEYIDIAPETFVDAVYLNDSRNGTVQTELTRISGKLDTVENVARAAAVLVVSETEPVAPSANMIWIKP